MKAELIRLYINAIVQQADDDLEDPANAVQAIKFGERFLAVLDALEDDDQTESN